MVNRLKYGHVGPRRDTLKRRDFLKAGIGGAFALWGLGDIMQEKTVMAAGNTAYL